MKWAIMFGFLMVVFTVALSAFILAAVHFIEEWRIRRALMQKIRALGL